MHHVTRTETTTYLGPGLIPVATVQPGEEVQVDTRTGPNVYPLEETLQRLNMDVAMQLSGPVAVAGAEAGDVLIVDIEEIALAEQGISLVDPRFGILKHEIREGFNRVIAVKGGFAEFSTHIRIPVNPMIGCIAVAPVEEHPRGNPGDYGANLDFVEIRAGSRLYLPVQVPGGLLLLGNVHAVMGEGEVTGLGLEIESSVRMRLDVIKDVNLEYPLIETHDHILIPGYGVPLDAAIQCATHRAVHYLASKGGLDLVEAYSLVSLACNVRLGSIVNEVTSASVHIPKYLFRQGTKLVP
ncbi:MAG: acetamidase/formamidase family protein [Anaerolineales bacterium]|nr:acetamidase/formamidase family protein [Anaerolineales bacterium]